MSSGDKDQLLRYVRGYKPYGAPHVRVLLYGPAGAGKSSFINSVSSAVTGRSSCVAAVNASASSNKTFTVEYKTYRFKIKGAERRTLPFVFNDTMALEDGEKMGVLPEDIKLAMDGRVKEGYTFNSRCALSARHKYYYNRNPTINDKAHVLVCVLNANKPNLHQSVTQKMTEIRNAARERGIPHITVATHIDCISNAIARDIKSIFQDIHMAKMSSLSSRVGIPLDSIVPVRNNYEGKDKDTVDAFLLTALKHMLDRQESFPWRAVPTDRDTTVHPFFLRQFFFLHFDMDQWRVIDTGKRDELRRYVTDYKLDAASHLRILLYGPVGAGKSSFINSAGSAITGKQVNVAEANASNETTSFTVQFKTHKFKIKGAERRQIPVVFNDIMGLEAGSKVGVLPEDIELAMRGHVKDGYTFNSRCALSERDRHYYNRHPTIDDKVHVLVCVLNANSPSFNPSVIQKVKDIRKAARDLEIPQVAVVTHIDEVCDEIEKDATKIFSSRRLKQKVDQISSEVGIPVNYIFPVINNYEGEQREYVDTLFLSTIRNMMNYGDDFLDELEN